MTIATVIVPDHVELTELPALAGLPDAALLALQGEIAASRRQPDAVGARRSAELGRRSAPELGYPVLAQRLLCPHTRGVAAADLLEAAVRLVAAAGQTTPERIAAAARSTNSLRLVAADLDSFTWQKWRGPSGSRGTHGPRIRSPSTVSRTETAQLS